MNLNSNYLYVIVKEPLPTPAQSAWGELLNGLGSAEVTKTRNSTR